MAEYGRAARWAQLDGSQKAFRSDTRSAVAFLLSRAPCAPGVSSLWLGLMGAPNWQLKYFLLRSLSGGRNQSTL